MMPVIFDGPRPTARCGTGVQGRRKRVAPIFLARLFSGETTATQKMKLYTNNKGMKGSAAAEKRLASAYLLDRMVKEESLDMVNLQSVEMICRAMYGLQKAWSRVHEKEDWERPKTLPQGQKWESKVQWELAKEYEITPDDDDAEPEIDEADKEVRARLQARALLSKHLSSLK